MKGLGAKSYRMYSGIRSGCNSLAHISSADISSCILLPLPDDNTSNGFEVLVSSPLLIFTYLSSAHSLASFFDALIPLGGIRTSDNHYDLQNASTREPHP
jgi:hypothetical protein